MQKKPLILMETLLSAENLGNTCLNKGIEGLGITLTIILQVKTQKYLHLIMSRLAPDPAD